MTMKKTAFFASIGAALVLPALAQANDVPPANAKPLSSILAMADNLGLGQVVEAEFDDGRWELTVCADRNCQKLYVDAVSGQETRRKASDSERLPPAGSKSMASVISQIEASNAGVVTSADFDDGYWKVQMIAQP